VLDEGYARIKLVASGNNRSNPVGHSTEFSVGLHAMRRDDRLSTRSSF